MQGFFWLKRARIFPPFLLIKNYNSILIIFVWSWCRFLFKFLLDLNFNGLKGGCLNRELGFHFLLPFHHKCSWYLPSISMLSASLQHSNKRTLNCQDQFIRRFWFDFYWRLIVLLPHLPYFPKTHCAEAINIFWLFWYRNVALLVSSLYLAVLRLGKRWRQIFIV